MAFKYRNSSCTVEDILKQVSEFDILAHYFNIAQLPILINSPLRKDTNASLSIYSPDGNRVKFKDFGTYDSGDIFDLLGRLWSTDLSGVIEKVRHELQYVNSSKINVTQTHERLIVKTETDLQVRTRTWRDYDLQYWNSFGISLEWLQRGEVYPISHIFLTKNGVTKIIPAEKLAYVYVEHKDNNVTLKVYQPLSSRFKWISKHDASVWDLWTLLPSCGDNLIITSSRKDALTLYANTGIPAVSLQGEGYLPKEHVINELQNRFKRIYVLFDNDFSSQDNHGHIFSEKLCAKFPGLISIEIPSEYKSKDPSDLVKNHGVETLQQVIYSLIK